MRLIFDLLGIVAHYTTAHVTLELLTLAAEAALEAYRPWLWRQKSLVECHGLVHDFDPHYRDWYAYYSTRKRTIYGHLVDSNQRRLSEASSPQNYYSKFANDKIIYHSADGLIQTTNLDIYYVRTMSKRRLNFGTPRRIISPSEKLPEDMRSSERYIVDERGILYTVVHDTLYPVLSGANVVEITDEINEDNNYYLKILTRTGKYYVFDYTNSKIKYSGTKFVSSATRIKTLDNNYSITRKYSALIGITEITIPGHRIVDFIMEPRFRIDGYKVAYCLSDAHSVYRVQFRSNEGRGIEKTITALPVTNVELMISVELFIVH